MKSIFLMTSIAGAVALAAPTAALAQTQTLTFSGTLQNGFNNSGPFGPANTSLTGKTYSVSLSYDPTKFVTSNFAINSCGPNAGTSCTFQFSSNRTLTETIVVNGVSQTNVATAGTLTLTTNGAGNDNFGFSFQNALGLSLSGSFTDSNSFFPNQNNVNNPTFSNFTNLAVSGGTFNQSGNGYSLGANPTALTSLFTPAATSAVPEPAAWAMMIGGFGMVGGAMRRQRKVKTTVSFA